MATHLTSADMINDLAEAGITIDDTRSDTTILRTTDEEAVSHVMILLFRRGFGITNSFINDDGLYEFPFAPLDGSPAPTFVLLYDFAGKRRPKVALCYREDGELKQFTMPYRWWAEDPLSFGGDALVTGFKKRFGDLRSFYWVPVLRYSPLVKI